MFEALVITLREGVEAALVLAIAAGILRREGRENRVPAMLAGAGVALVVSLLLAVLATHITYNQEIVEGTAMLVGAVFVLSLTWWMWRAAPRMKQDIEAGLARGSGHGLLGVALFGFVMVIREGFETAVFLSAAEFNSSGLQLLAGALIGLALATVFGVLFARGAFKVPLKPFFSLTTAVLLLLAFQLLVGGLHELSEGKVLPASRTEMALVGPLIKNELLLFTLTLALAVGWMLLGAGRAVAAPAADASGPESRLARAAAARDATWRRGLAMFGLLVVGLLAAAFITRSRIPGPEPAATLVAEGDGVAFEAGALADGRMHFYETKLPSGNVRFFAIRVGTEIKTCLDACEICGPKGYFMQGGTAVCRNCTSPIALTSLGRGGGCNPVPLPSRRDGERVRVSVADLEAARTQGEGH
jgi:high-affinity iron transporter